MYFEMPTLCKGKNSTYNMPFNHISNVGSSLYGFNICTFLMASCANNLKKKRNSFGLFFFLAHFEAPCIVHKQDHFLHI